jgi:hypothetical protein
MVLLAFDSAFGAKMVDVSGLGSNNGRFAVSTFPMEELIESIAYVVS